MFFNFNCNKKNLISVIGFHLIFRAYAEIRKRKKLLINRKKILIMKVASQELPFCKTYYFELLTAKSSKFHNIDTHTLQIKNHMKTTKQLLFGI